MSNDFTWCGGHVSKWPLMPIKYGFSRIGSGTTPPSEKTEYYGGGIPWVTTSELRENRITETVQTVTESAVEEFSTLKTYEPDTILFAMYGATIGRVASLGIAATVNQAVCALSEPTRFVPGFVAYCLQASREYLVSVASGGGQPNLNAAKLRDHMVPCPSLSIQQIVADYLDLETAEIDTLIAEKERSIQLLKERRSALIASAVTGLIPVEEMAR
jgi:type I restriction enzyme S subunit